MLTKKSVLIGSEFVLFERCCNGGKVEACVQNESFGVPETSKPNQSYDVSNVTGIHGQYLAACLDTSYPRKFLHNITTFNHGELCRQKIKTAQIIIWIA